MITMDKCTFVAWLFVVVQLSNCANLRTVDGFLPKLFHSVRNVTEYAVVGSSVSFPCYSNSTVPMRWRFTEPNATDHVNIMKRRQLAARRNVTVDEKTGQNALTINAVQLNDSGRYSCLDLRGFMIQTQFDLIVLASNPSCITSASAVNNGFDTVCSGDYSGNVAPRIQCTSVLDINVTKVTTDGVKFRHITYSMSMRNDENHEQRAVDIVCRSSLSATPFYTWTFNVSQTDDGDEASMPVDRSLQVMGDSTDLEILSAQSAFPVFLIFLVILLIAVTVATAVSICIDLIGPNMATSRTKGARPSTVDEYRQRDHESSV